MPTNQHEIKLSFRPLMIRWLRIGWTPFDPPRVVIPADDDIKRGWCMKFNSVHIEVTCIAKRRLWPYLAWYYGRTRISTSRNGYNIVKHSSVWILHRLHKPIATSFSCYASLAFCQHKLQCIFYVMNRNARAYLYSWIDQAQLCILLLFPRTIRQRRPRRFSSIFSLTSRLV